MLRTPEPQQQARILATLLQDKGFKLKHQAALDIIAQLHGHRNWQVLHAAQAAPAEELSQEEFCVAGFNVNDVLSVRPDLPEEEALEVLHFIAHHYDASIGLNWDRLEEYSYQWSNKCYAVEGFVCALAWSGPVVVRLSHGTLVKGTLQELQDRRRAGVRDEPILVPFCAGAVLRIPNMPEISLEGETQLMGGESDGLRELICEMRDAHVHLTAIVR